MKHTKVIDLNKYPIATISSLIGIGAFSGELDFMTFSLSNLLIAMGRGLVEFISWYIFIKILVWVFSRKKKTR